MRRTLTAAAFAIGVGMAGQAFGQTIETTTSPRFLDGNSSDATSRSSRSFMTPSTRGANAFRRSGR